MMIVPRFALSAIMACVFFLLPILAQAHEFWIEPKAYQVAPGEVVRADLRLGEEFSGSSFPFNPRSFERFDYALGTALAPVPGRAGDRPAVQMVVPQEGLLVLAHETNALGLTYTDMAKFTQFLEHKDWVPLLEEHRARGLSEERFTERYTRHVKSLIAIGSGAGADRAFGLQTEIVALTNPYTSGAREMAMQVFLEGAPRRNVQLELFDKAPDGAVTVTLHRTNNRGIVRVPVTSGHSYFADAVVIRAVTPTVTNTAVWESLWAGLTFAVP